MFTTRKDAFDRIFDETMLDMLSTFKPKNESMKIDGDDLVMSFDVPKFFKSYKIQKSWDVKNTSAEVKNGILTLTIPKKEIKKDLVEISVK